MFFLVYQLPLWNLTAGGGVSIYGKKVMLVSGATYEKGVTRNSDSLDSFWMSLVVWEK